MPRWKKVLNIGDLHEKYENKEITVSELSNQFADRLATLPYKEEPEINLAIMMLREAEEIDEYDAALKMVYDFGDAGHQLWVDTSR